MTAGRALLRLRAPRLPPISTWRASNPVGAASGTSAFRAAAVFATLAVAGCGPSTKLPPLPTPGPDFCILYRAFNYAPAAAAVENVETLKKHIANETDFMRDCIGDRSKSGGPR